MVRDPLVEEVAAQLEAVHSKAVKMAQELFGLTKRDEPAYRITILALMKDIISLMELKKLERT